MTSSPLFAVGPFGPTEMLIVLFIVVLLFGAKKLPELAKGLGKAKNEFQKASNEVEKEINAPLESKTESTTESKTTEAPPKQTSTTSVPPGNN
jgi:sec-independent protein translocase protein TatA